MKSSTFEPGLRCLSYLNSMSDIVYENIKFQFIQKIIVSFKVLQRSGIFIRIFIPLTDKIEAGADISVNYY